MNSSLSGRLRVVPITILAAVGALIVMQVMTTTTLAAGLPIEFGEKGAYLALCAASFLAAVTVRPAGYRKVLMWIGLGVAFAALFVVDVVGVDRLWPSVPVADDISTIAAWCITTLAMIFALRHPRLSPTARAYLLTGFALQSLAFLADLGDGSMFDVTRRLSSISLSSDICDLAGLGAYLSGLLVMTVPLVFGPLGEDERIATEQADVKAYNWLMSTPVRYVAMLAEDTRYALWRLRNPHAEFGAYYAAVISASLDRGGSHVHLGRRRWIKSIIANRKGEEWESDAYAQRGREIFERLCAHGITPQSTVVDYGCGSLRVGQHFIRMLQPGRFWGLDVTDRFYRDGLDLLGEDTAVLKQPNLHVIDDEALAAARRAEPDFVYSIAVLRFVPPGELESFWQRLLSLMPTGATAVVEFQMAPHNMRILGKDWAYTETDICDTIGKLRPGATIRIEELPREGKPKTAWKRAAAIITDKKA